mmetsp:Transcript_13085/g.52754  ORF Transcript_13085/g.52754 Transcript_13085/m.52754 type:complete len:646 (+) Transcript_13085:191-2128(+)
MLTAPAPSRGAIARGCARGFAAKGRAGAPARVVASISARVSFRDVPFRVALAARPGNGRRHPLRNGTSRRGPRVVAAVNPVSLVAEAIAGGAGAKAAGVATAAAGAAASTVTNAATSAAAAGGGGFMGYVFSFLFGGVFFSTLLGVAALFISVGGENVRRAWRVFNFLGGRVWALVVKTAAAVKESLQAENTTLEDTKKVLLEGYQATKREVDDALTAFNQERDFYAAAVGIPGLRTAQYVIDHMMPGLIAQKLENSMADSIANVKHRNVKKMILKGVKAGTAAPLLTGARFYDVGDRAMAFDVDVKWTSEVTATMDVVPEMGLLTDLGGDLGGLTRVPVMVHNVNFDGTIRVLMAELTREDPGYGAVVLSFPDPPQLSLDVRVLGGLEVNRVPWLRRVVVDATKTWIKEEMLWPQRMLIPAEKNVAKGEKPGFVLTDAQLKKVLQEDPLLLAEQRLKSLQQIATGEIGQKREPGEGLASGDEDDPTGPEIDVELTDPSNPRVIPPKPTAQQQAWAWLSGTAKVTADKTVDLSIKTVEVTKQVATSEETKTVVKNVGTWFQRDLGGWVNNVAARAQGKVQTDVRGYPKADAWTEAPKQNKAGAAKMASIDESSEEGANGNKNGGKNGVQKNGGAATNPSPAPGSA